MIQIKEPVIPEILSERRAKINRREIVESEDSDRMSSASGTNSDDYTIPDKSRNKKMTKVSFGF